jgi:DNA polymerase III gamma/tau subunit
MDYNQNLFGEKVLVEREEEVFDLKKALPEFNIFAFTDAFGKRNKRESWILYQKALAAGVSSEEIFFKIIWQIKTMLIAFKTKNAEEADMKPFPYNKAKSFLKNWKQEELENLSEKLVVGYHEIRRGKGEMETFVEKTILSV